MPVVGVLGVGVQGDTVDRLGLAMAWAVAERGLQTTWLEWGTASKHLSTSMDGRTERRWRQGRLRTTATVANADVMPPFAGRPNLALIPGWCDRKRPDKATAAKELRQYLNEQPAASWHFVREEEDWRTGELFVACDLLLVVCSTTGDTLRRLRRGLPAAPSALYIWLEDWSPEDGREHLLQHLPGAFAEGAPGASLPLGRVVSPECDPNCAGSVPRWVRSKWLQGVIVTRNWSAPIERLAARLGSSLPAVTEVGVLDWTSVPRFVAAIGPQVSQDGPFTADLARYGRAQSIVDCFRGGGHRLVVGDPGVGKSKVAKSLRQEGVDYAALGSFRVDDTVSGCTETVLVLDGADEFTAGPNELVAQVIRGLRRRRERPGAGELALWVFGREGEWREALAAELNLEPDDQLRLLPLRRCDVEPLAREFTGTPSTGLLEDALSKGLGAIASLPLGVKLLATLWERAGALPTDRVEVYRQGLEALLEKDPSPSRTLGVAEPLAWAVVATGSGELRRGVAPDSIDLIKAERCFATLAGRDVAAAMRSSVFAPSNGGWRFVHRSFAEYLAACFVKAQPLRRSHLSDLLVRSGRVPERLLAFTHWLAEMDPSVLDLVAERDPVALLGSKLPASPEAQRRLLVRLADEMRAGRHSPWADHLGSFDPAALVDELAELQRDRSPEVQRLAVMVLANAEPSVAIDTLTATATDEGLPAGVRHTAVELLRRPTLVTALGGRSDLVDELRALLLDQATGGEMTLDLLWLLWPEHLKSLEALRALARPGLGQTDRGYFIATHGAALVAALDAAEYLIGALKLVEEGHLPALNGEGLRDQILQRAWEAADDRQVTEALGRALGAEAERHALGRANVNFGTGDLARMAAVLVPAVEGSTDEADFQLIELGIWLPVEELLPHAERALRASGVELALRWLEFLWSACLFPPRELDDRLRAVAAAVGESVRWEARLEARDNPKPRSQVGQRPRRDREERVSLSEELNQWLDSDDRAWGWIQVSGGSHRQDLKPDVLEPDEVDLASRLAAVFLQEPPEDVRGLSLFEFRVATERALRFQPDADLGESPPILAACGMTLAPQSQADAGLRRLLAACPDSPAELLGRVIEQSPSSLATALTWCGGEIPESLVERILSVLTGLLESRDAGVVHQVHGTLGSLLCVASAEEQAWSWAVEQLVQGRWAVAPALFRHAPARAWAVTEGLLAHDEAAVGLLSAVADVPEAWSRLEGQRATGILERLEELFGDALRPANGRVNTENRLHERRREVLSALVDAGAFEALEAASQALRLSPLAVERARRARADTPMSLEEAARFERRLASSEDLLDRLMFALDQIQEDLGGPHSPYPGFFDRQHANRKEWRRKHETEACALLVYLLRQQLGDVRFDLEVQEYNGEDRIDITAAVSPRVRVKVEVKWDKNHPTEAVADQLERYLQGDAVPAGLLLVLMPPPRLALRGGPPQAVDEEALRTACAKLSNELGGRAVSPYVLTLGRSR